MTALLKQPRWSPYWVGAGIGILSWITFLFMDKALGVSTTMVRLAGTPAARGPGAGGGVPAGVLGDYWLQVKQLSNHC